jgi:hypothetical protein
MDPRDEIAAAMLQQPVTPNPAQPPEWWNQGVRNVASTVANYPGDLAKRAIGAAQHYTDTGEYNPEPIVEATGALATGGMPMAKRGAAGMFGGVLAQGAPLAKLGRAENMELRGATPQEIWAQTGWLRRPDTKWRHEFSDRGAGFDPEALAGLAAKQKYSGQTEYAPLGAVYKHPAMYEAYPWAKDIRFSSEKLGKNIQGAYGPPQESVLLPGRMTNPTLEINQSLARPVKNNVTLHELMHSVQGKEGFAIGGAPPRSIQPGTPAFSISRELHSAFAPDNLAKLSPEEFAKLLNFKTKVPTRMEQLTFITHMRDMEKRRAASEHFAGNMAYDRLLGESEARLVQSRAPMSLKARRETFPTLDVPEDKLIMRMRDTDVW